MQMDHHEGTAVKDFEVVKGVILDRLEESQEKLRNIRAT
jgi:hypothetical protein